MNLLYEIIRDAQRRMATNHARTYRAVMEVKPDGHCAKCATTILYGAQRRYSYSGGLMYCRECYSQLKER